MRTTLNQLRLGMRPAAFRNLLVDLFEQEHNLETSLGRGQLESIRPVARRHNRIRTHVPAAAERRLDFASGKKVAV